MSTLIEELKQVPDFRKAHGRSHPLWILLLLMIMGILAGYQGYRPLHTFAKEHQHALCELLACIIHEKFQSFREESQNHIRLRLSNRICSFIVP